jgi:hypothetical protein
MGKADGTNSLVLLHMDWCCITWITERIFNLTGSHLETASERKRAGATFI